MSKAKTVDLTSGPILKTLAELALPIMISSMLGTAYSIMDMAWIGLLGAKAVAGVGGRRNVCLALPGTCIPVKNGRTGKYSSGMRAQRL